MYPIPVRWAAYHQGLVHVAVSKSVSIEINSHLRILGSKSRRERSRLQGYKTLFILNSAENEINPAHKCVKMPTLVGILTFISMIDPQHLRDLKLETSVFCRYFSFNEQLKFRAQLSQA